MNYIKMMSSVFYEVCVCVCVCYRCPFPAHENLEIFQLPSDKYIFVKFHLGYHYDLFDVQV